MAYDNNHGRECRDPTNAACLQAHDFDVSGPLRMLNLGDSWYVIGEGQFVPVEGREEATALVEEFA